MSAPSPIDPELAAELGADLGADRAQALKLTPVPREVEARLEKFAALLRERQQRLNLVAASTLPHLWTRHIADSLQLLALPPQALVWADFGSGAGFPGIPIACMLAGRAGAKVHLIESHGKKAAFLREAVQVTGASAVVHWVRAEEFAQTCAETIDVVTARALAPLKTLCDQTFPLIAKGAVGVFPKGQHVEAELTEAAKYWTLEARKVPSVTSPDSAIVVINGLKRRKNS